MFGVIERRRGLRFAKNEAFFFFRSTDQVGSKKLEGGRMFELHVLSPVDDGKATLAKRFQDFVSTQRLSHTSALLLIPRQLGNCRPH